MATNSANQRWQSPVWTFTTATAEGPPVADDFSSDLGWVDRSDGEFMRDPDAAMLTWQVKGGGDRRFFLPVDLKSDNVRLSFRVNLVAGSGNQLVYVGLAEQLEGAWQMSAFPTGFFIQIVHVSEGIPHLRHFISYVDNAPETSGETGACGDMTCADPDTYLALGDLDRWRGVELTVRQGTWQIDLFDEAGTLLDSQAGHMSGRHDRYRYLLLMASGPQLWEWLHGQIDDVVLDRATP